jgi:FAD binding domain
MHRRTFLKSCSLTALEPLLPRAIFAGSASGLQRSAHAAWPAEAAWKQLNEAVGGNLVSIDPPFAACGQASASAACTNLFENIKNPYYVGDQPGLTQTLGWVDAWTSQPSAYAVAARNAKDVAAAVNFARENHLRLAIKGGGHSYQGTSNAADSLLVWTRHMNDIAIRDAFVPQGCEGVHPPQRAVTPGAGAIWMQAYEAVTTRGGAYVQGGGYYRKYE